MTFDGFPVAALDFYEDLENDNSKGFWTAHKTIYDEAVRMPLDALITELQGEFGRAKIFRPYRDVRFAKDKSPYKTQQGVYFSQTRRYFHISAAGLFVGGGYYDMSGEQITRYRRAAADDVTAAGLVAALTKSRRAKLELGGEQLTRVPSGYPKDHPREDLLRRKSVVLRRDLGFGDWLQSARAKTELVLAWRAMAPLITWLDNNVGRG
jgi:uncharacterized protein (TIGR02453 family)